MTEKPALIEASFADGIMLISASKELPEQTRRHWASSLRQIAKALDRPIEVIPARYSAVRADLLSLHHVPAGLTAKTLQNHRSNAKSALLWLARERGIPQHGVPLSAEWEDLRGRITEPLLRSRLSSLMRFCSANGISPGQVDEATVDRLLAYRSQCGKSADNPFRRLTARAWNGNVGTAAGWPKRRLVEPAIKSSVEIPWSDFPPGLQQDIQNYLRGLTKIRKNRLGHRIRPLKDITIRTRRAELQGAARMAVKAGAPIKQLDSLAALLAPAVVEKVLEAYCEKNGKSPKLYTVDLAARFLAIARETKCLSESDCELLNDFRLVTLPP